MASLEAWLSLLEGTLEQMNERLGNLEQGPQALQGKTRSNFRWTLGLILVV